MSERGGRSSARPRDAQQWLALVYGVVTLAPPLLMLLHIVVSLALAGGQAVAGARRLWGEVVRYPVVVIPDWLILGLAAIALILVVPLVVLTPPRRAGGLVGLQRFTFGTIIADGFFAFAFPATSGPIPLPSDDELALGPYWIGVPVAAVCALVLLVRILQTSAEHTRLIRAGRLEEH